MNKVCVHIPYGNALTIVTDAYTTGLYVQVQPGVQNEAVALEDDATVVVGPFDEPRDYEIEYDVNQPTLTNEKFLVGYATEYADSISAGILADGATEWQAGIEQDIADLQSDDEDTVHSADIANMITTSNKVDDLTALGEANVVEIGNSATGTEIATAVNGILAILVVAGLMDAPA